MFRNPPHINSLISVREVQLEKGFPNVWLLSYWQNMTPMFWNSGNVMKKSHRHMDSNELWMNERMLARSGIYEPNVWCGSKLNVMSSAWYDRSIWFVFEFQTENQNGKLFRNRHASGWPSATWYLPWSDGWLRTHAPTLNDCIHGEWMDGWMVGWNVPFS